MAQFTTQGRLKLLFNGECVSSLLDHKDPFFHHKCSTSIQTHHRKRLTKHIGSSCSYLSTKTNRCNAQARPTVGNEGAHDEEDDDDFDIDVDEFENDDLSCFRGLVLDISYRPVNVVGWKRAICLEFMEKADVLEYYAQTVNSPSGSFYIPAVLRVPYLLQVVKRKLLSKNLSRKNILFRDNSTCQYCSSREHLTIDHVVPIALGGEWTWENLYEEQRHTGKRLKKIMTMMDYIINQYWNQSFKEYLSHVGKVTACVKCNSKKGHKTLEEAKMRLIKVPKAPKDYDILAIPLTSAAIQMMAVKKRTPEEWRQYLSKSSSEP